MCQMQRTGLSLQPGWKVKCILLMAIDNVITEASRAWVILLCANDAEENKSKSESEQGLFYRFYTKTGFSWVIFECLTGLVSGPLCNNSTIQHEVKCRGKSGPLLLSRLKPEAIEAFGPDVLAEDETNRAAMRLQSHSTFVLQKELGSYASSCCISKTVVFYKMNYRPAPFLFFFFFCIPYPFYHYLVWFRASLCHSQCH